MKILFFSENELRMIWWFIWPLSLVGISSIGSFVHQTLSVIIIEVDVLAASIARIETVIWCKWRSCEDSRPLALFIVVLTQLILDAQRRAKFCLALIATVTEVKQSEYQLSQEKEKFQSRQALTVGSTGWLTWCRHRQRRSPSCSRGACLAGSFPSCRCRSCSTDCFVPCSLFARSRSL